MQYNIYSQVRYELDSFINNYVEIVPGYSYNQYDTIKKNHLYSLSKFVKDDLYCGRKKVFFNIVNNPCAVATRFLNFDTKDIRLLPTNPKSEIGTMFLQKELKYWLKEKGFAHMLNEMAEKAPKYGSVVIKKTKTGAKVVDLRKLVLDPTVDTIRNSSHVIMEHSFSPEQLRKKGKENGWDNIEEAINKFTVKEGAHGYIDEYGRQQTVASPHIKVWERYGSVPEKWLNGDMSLADDTDKMVNALFIVCGAKNEVTTENGDKYFGDGLILFKGAWTKDWPFYDYHYTKVEGRWLGVGVIEELWISQERVNELANQKRIAMELSSKHIFQTQDKTIIRSILNDVENGAVLMSGPNGGMTPLVNEERNLAAFGSEEVRWNDLAKNLSFSYDAVRGESLPSSTPATNAAIQDKNANSVFAFKRENLGIMLKCFVEEEVLPQLVRELSKEHVLAFTGSQDEFLKLDLKIADVVARNTAMAKLLKGQVVSQEEYEAYKSESMKQLKKMGAKRWITIKENLYRDLDLQVDIVITNEQEDLQLVSQNLFNVIGAMGKMNLQDPMVKALFMKYLEKVGISPAELEMLEEQKQGMEQMQPMQGLQTPPQMQQPQQVQNMQ